MQAEIIVAPNNDGTGRSDYHVVITEAGEHVATYGGFAQLRQARQCAREQGAYVVAEEKKC